PGPYPIRRLENPGQGKTPVIKKGALRGPLLDEDETRFEAIRARKAIASQCVIQAFVQGEEQLGFYGPGFRQILARQCERGRDFGRKDFVEGVEESGRDLEKMGAFVHRLPGDHAVEIEIISG